MRRSLRLLLWFGLLVTICQIVVVSRAWTRNAIRSFQSARGPSETTNAGQLYLPEKVVLELVFTDALSRHWKTSESKDPMPVDFTLNVKPFSGTFRLWGQGSRYLKHTRRRSFHLEVAGPFSMPLRNDLSASRLLFLSLFEDQYRLAYYSSIRLLAPLGLWYASAILVEVRCRPAGTGVALPDTVCGPNGSTFGVYLAVEDPVDAIRRHVASGDHISSQCARMISQAVNWTGQQAYAEGEVALDVAYRWTDKNKVELLTNVPVVEGTEDADRILPAMYAELLQHRDEWAQRLDAAQYLRWVAANTLLHNGDYIDEVFFYGMVPKKGKPYHRPVLQLVGWDYDTILKPCHPVPLRYRLKRVDDSLIFCGESKLDHFMHVDNRLRTLYRKVLVCMIQNEITQQAWNNAVDAAYTELKLYTITPEVAQVTWEGGSVPDIAKGAAELKLLFANNIQKLSTALEHEGELVHPPSPLSTKQGDEGLSIPLPNALQSPVPELNRTLYFSASGATLISVAVAANSAEVVTELQSKYAVHRVLRFQWAEQYEANLLRFTLGRDQYGHLFFRQGNAFVGLAILDLPSDTPSLQRDLSALQREECQFVVSDPTLLEGHLSLLLGFPRAKKVLNEIQSGSKANPLIYPVTANTFGFAGHWESFDDLFVLLRLLGIETVVLRNHEELASNAQHPDVDLLSANWMEACYISAGRPSVCVIDRNRPMLRKVTAGGRMASFDFTSVGDGYYCDKWQEDMLRTKQKVTGLHQYNVLAAEHHFYSLLYHALYHKPKMAADYKVKLAALAPPALPPAALTTFNISDVHSLLLLLDRFMVRHGYNYTRPQNRFVAWQEQRTKPYTTQSFEEHLIILWAKARIFETQLLQEVQGKFSLQFTQEIAWHEDCFLPTMHAFYGINLQFMEKKVVRCGSLPALLLVFRDYTPQYSQRRTSSGRKSVNINVFDLKQDWRERLGQHYQMSQGNLLGKKFYMDCFHGTNNKKEITHDLAVLQSLGYSGCPRNST